MASEGEGAEHGSRGGAELKTLWRWSVVKDEWEYVTKSTPENCKATLRGYKRRDAKGIKFRWTDGQKPKKFRTRRKASE